MQIFYPGGDLRWQTTLCGTPKRSVIQESEGCYQLSQVIRQTFLDLHTSRGHFQQFGLNRAPRPLGLLFEAVEERPRQMKCHSL